jgi:hypothetical protein
MSRGFLKSSDGKKNLHHFEKVLRNLFEEQGRKDFDEKYGERLNDEVFKAAARLVRFLATDYGKFLELCRSDENYNDSYFKGQPIITLAKDPTMLRVYPNLIVDSMEIEELKSCSWAFEHHVLDTQMKLVKQELADEHKKQGWATLARAIAKFTRYEEMTTSRVLARFTGAKELRANQIAAFAAGIDEMRVPAQLVYAEKPEDFVEMYATGPGSCMSWSKGDERTWEFMPDHLDIHPTSFFAFHPYTKGCYIKSKGKVAARAILYNVRDGEWQYGRVYASNTKMHTIFENALRDAGINTLETNFGRSADFDMNIYEFKGKQIVPMPYFDNIGGAMHLKLDEKEKVVKVSIGSKVSGANYSSEGGYVNVAMLKTITCSCGREWSGKHAQQVKQSQDGLHWFCNIGCGEAKRYVFAYRNDGTQVYIHKGEAVMDALGGRYYTNLAAAKALGCHPYLENLDDAIDPEKITQTGHAIYTEDGKTIVRIHDNLFRKFYTTSHAVRSPAAASKLDKVCIYSDSAEVGGWRIGRPGNKIKIALKRVAAVILDDNDKLVA